MSRMLLFLILVSLPASGGAAETEPGNDPVVRASLLATRVSPDGRAVMAIRLEINDGWHLYWVNPGDSGLPLDVRWNLPAGSSAGPLEFPTPKKFTDGGLIAYGYEDEVVVLCGVRFPPDGDSMLTYPVSAELDWLVCKESCVPGSASVSLEVGAGTAAPANLTEKDIRTFRERMPRPDLTGSGIRLASVDLEPDSDRFILSLSFEGPSVERIEDFYPEPVEDFTIHHGEIAVRGGTVTVPITPSVASSRLKAFRGVLVCGRTGYLIDHSLQP